MTYFNMLYKRESNSKELDWNKVAEILKCGCYCISLNTDMTSYIDLDAHERNCFEIIEEYLKEKGWVGEILDINQVIRRREERRKARITNMKNRKSSVKSLGRSEE